jgi:hypothetical protein
LEIYDHDQQDDPILRTLLSERKQVETSLRNLMRAIEDGLYTPTTKKRLEELEKQQAELSSRIAIQQSSRPQISRDHLQYFLESFQGGDVNDPTYRRRVIESLVHSVTITDGPAPDDGSKPDRTLRIVYNLTDNNASTIDLSTHDGVRMQGDLLHQRELSRTLQLYVSAGVFVLTVTIKAPE